MKAAYIVIFSSLLAFPLSLALAERFGSRHCPAGAPCLPRDLDLTPAQQKALRAIYEQNLREQQLVQQQTRRALLRLLTPEQRQHLRSRDLALRESPLPDSSPARL